MVFRLSFASVSCPATPKSAARGGDSGVSKQRTIQRRTKRASARPSERRTELRFTVGAEQDVAGLDVAVDLAQRRVVEVVQAAKRILAHGGDLVLGQRSIEDAHDVSHRASRAVLHDDLRESGAGAGRSAAEFTLAHAAPAAGQQRGY